MPLSQNPEGIRVRPEDESKVEGMMPEIENYARESKIRQSPGSCCASFEPRSPGGAGRGIWEERREMLGDESRC
jgi:hypothetical protein